MSHEGTYYRDLVRSLVDRPLNEPDPTPYEERIKAMRAEHRKKVAMAKSRDEDQRVSEYAEQVVLDEAAVLEEAERAGVTRLELGPENGGTNYIGFFGRLRNQRDAQ